MNGSFEKIHTAQCGNADILVAMARSTFDTLEQLVEFNVVTGRGLLGTAGENARQLARAKDALEFGMCYSRCVYGVASEVRKRFADAMALQSSTFANVAACAVRTPTLARPPGYDVVQAAMGQLLRLSAQVGDGLVQVARQTSSLNAEVVPNVARKTAPSKRK